MPTPCVIRFTDGEAQAHVYRRDHGHPEEVITNLSAVKSAVESQRVQPTPGNIASQFVFLDMLWYALREVPLGNLEKNLLTLLYSPVRHDTEEASYLH